jgi:RNA polymerase sigma-70 factor (ECF subfamily)
MTTKDSALDLLRVFGIAEIADVTTGAIGASESDARSTKIEHEVIGLFDEHRTRLLRYVMSIGLSVHDGEEVVQEVFLALFRHLSLGRGRDNLRGWLFRVAHNLALKQREAVQTRPDRAELDEAVVARQVDPTPSPEQRVASGQRQKLLLATLKALPERDQHCVHLRAEGLRYREIAQVMDMSLGAVSISLARSMARLERADRG